MRTTCSHIPSCVLVESKKNAFPLWRENRLGSKFEISRENLDFAHEFGFRSKVHISLEISDFEISVKYFRF